MNKLNFHKEKALIGKNFLITRDFEDNLDLKKKLEFYGAYIDFFSMYEVVDINIEFVDKIKKADIWIFVSKNSINESFRNVDFKGDIFAIGKRTADKASLILSKKVNYPKGKPNSENLFSLICDLYGGVKNLVDKNIIIFRGKSGRSFLKNKLEENQAKVSYKKVYELSLIRDKKYYTSLKDKINKGFIYDRIIFTNIASLKNMIIILGGVSKNLLKQKITVSSTRMAEFAEGLGFKDIFILDDFSNDYIVKELLNLTKENKIV